MHAPLSPEQAGLDMEQELRLVWRRLKQDDTPWLDCCAMLRRHRLRPTRQRVVLARLLFAKGHRHVTAASLHDEAMQARIPMSLATVYNTLNNFTEAGLLRRITITSTISFFDTNTSHHHHFFIESEQALHDIAPDDVHIAQLPQIPDDASVEGVDVVVRLRRTPTGRVRR
ncbi:hypothetical protein GCM10007301_28610 [Azorhizobium oxalatiphilum]|uniref:Ferric uptake regulation protein n=1 Tax=Azorhizobium oxalatiphilum TaxID=980631 RepID=A0A917C273_9HYPH|nr:Fur family transcriptional regulator [Azorhizobium oxalatiphilum]GGF67217.1 hypothetical protein GCM10007301_28610 [Azorhizobium oxalatiphilum]